MHQVGSFESRNAVFKLQKSRSERSILMKPDDLSPRLLELAVRVGRVVDALPENRLGRHIAGQLVRSGTSPAPNYEEACAAESRRDFIHKVRIALKELRETRCWI